MDAVDGFDHYSKIVATVMTILEAEGYPDRFSTMNRRGPSDIWKIGMLVLMRCLDKTFSSVVDLMGSCPGVLRLGGIAEPLEESTLRKFSYRLDDDLLDDLTMKSAMLLRSTSTRAAVDATGLSDTNASTHYVKRIGQIDKKRTDAPQAYGLTYTCTPVRGFVKVSLLVDVSTHCIYATDVSLDHSADVTRFRPLVDMIAGKGLNVEYLLADKGYDAEYIHEYVEEVLGAKAVIPAREAARTSLREHPKGYNRRQMEENWEEVYHPIYVDRSNVEGVNSEIKRISGDAVRSRRSGMKVQEVKLRSLAQNIRKLLKSNLVHFGGDRLVS